MNYNFLLITEKKDLKLYKNAISDLFNKSYNQTLNSQIWDWLYIENPFGDPVVSLAYKDSELAGHYAVIPFYLEKDGIIIQSYLSLTTMVHPNHRGNGLFVTQASQVYEHLEKMGADLVYGFPNSNSAHGFKKYLSWAIPESDYIAKCSGKDLLNSKDFQNYLSHKNLYHFPIKEKMYLKWRLRNKDYFETDHGIWKKFKNSYDLLHVNHTDNIDVSIQIELLVDHSVNDLKNFKVADYQFGFRYFKPEYSNFNIKKSMILSDVF